ncbi:tetratricopeptide repeat protein [Spirillospora sp. NPDC046719]
MSSFTPNAALCKMLFGRANRCAYPGCGRALIAEHRGALSVDVEIAHIRSGKPNGPRHDPSFAPEKIDTEPNLLLLCRQHHSWVDDHPQVYSADELQEWKRAQIAQNDGIDLSDGQVEQIMGMTRGPIHLPYRGEGIFVGRVRELAWLDQTLITHDAEGGLSPAASGQVIVMHGLGGVGKSTLAAHWAQRHVNDHHLTWWLTADNEQSLQQGLAGLAIALDPAAGQERLESLAVRAVNWLASHGGWLLILDNVVKPGDVASLLGRCRTGRVLVTSRLATGWQRFSAHVLSLGVLEPDQAVDLLARNLNQSAASMEAAEDLCAELGHLPLAIEQASGYIAETGCGSREYLEMLRDYPAEMYAHWPASYEDINRTVARVWRATLDHLVSTFPNTGDLLRTLAWFAPNDIPRVLVRALAEEFGGVPQTEAAIGRLAAYNLISANDAVIGTHRLVQAVARTPDVNDIHRQPNDIAVAKDRAARALLAAAPRDTEAPDTWPWWQTILPHIGHLSRQSLPEDDSMFTGVLLNTTGAFLAEHAIYKHALDCQLRALAVSERLLGEDDTLTMSFRNDVACVYEHLGELELAIPIYEKNLLDRERLLGKGHRHTRTSRSNLALAYSNYGKSEKATPLLEETALQQSEELGPHHPDTLTAYTNLGRHYLRIGQSQESLVILERTLSRYEWHFDINEIGAMDARDALACAYIEISIRAQELMPLWGEGAREGVDSEKEMINALAEKVELGRTGLLLKEQNLKDAASTLGAGHPYTLAFVHSLAGSYLATGYPERAVGILEAAIPGFEATYDQDHPAIRSVSRLLKRARSAARG